MKQITVYTTDSEYSHFITLARNLHYVKKIETDEMSKKRAVDHIRAGLEDVILFKQGKLQTTPAKNFLDEL